jgi:hypothetical protein
MGQRIADWRRREKIMENARAIWGDDMDLSYGAVKERLRQAKRQQRKFGNKPQD